MVTAERLDKAMNLLATTDLECATRKAQVLRTEFMAKHAEALVYKALGNEGSVEDRKQAVRLHESVVKAWDEHFNAVRDFEALKARREREVLVVELWRSMNANRRAGNIQ
jgi:hypothetical protein